MNENCNASSPRVWGAEKLCRLPVLLLLLVLMTLDSLYAQEFTSFRGRVTDPSGAIAVGAKITATDDKTGVSISTTSNEAGEYELLGLPPGTFTIDAELTGFKKYKNTGVIAYA